MSDPNKKNLLVVVKDWIDERTGLIKAGAEFLHEEIPGGTRFSYTLGSACMFLLTLQIVTGIWQLFYYVPTVDYAYSSLSYLRLQVPFGWLIHGIHYWGGTLFTICVGLHCLRVFIWGSYKRPREMVWLIGIILIVLTALFMFTGPVLPWDKDGFFAGQVGIGIAGSVPIVGPLTQAILQGANKMGQMALLRMYVLHVAILPGAIGLFVMLHLVAFRKYGESGPWDAEKRKTVGYFWPEQIFKDVVVSFLIFLLLVYLCAFHPAPFSGLADPSDTLVSPKPAWPFLFLYQALKLFPGNLEFLGTAGIPLVIILLFASLPFADKSPEKNPFKRGIVLLCGFAFVGVVLYFTYLGYIYRSQAELSQMEPPQKPVVESSEEKAKLTDSYEAMMAANQDQHASGEKLFKTLGCTECHTVTGVASDKLGPDLAMARGNNRTREWLYTQITSPQTHNAKTIMPPFLHLSDKNVNLLIDYLESLTPPQAPPPLPAGEPATTTAGATTGSTTAASADNASQIKYGEQLFNTVGCVQCHTITGSSSSLKLGPDLVFAIKRDKPSKDWLKDQLTTPQSHNPTSVMPSFAGKLNDQQMSAMIEFLSSLSTRQVAAGASDEGAESGTGQGTAPSSPSGVVMASGVIGDKDHGAILFHQSCIMCHGPHGDNKLQFNGYYVNANAANGTIAPKGVPRLNPIDRSVFNVDPQAFINHIDQFLQHGIPNTEGGPNMPAFGDSHALSQAQIADIEAYILSLNGVDRTMILNPGIEPKEFFYMLLWISIVILMLAGFYWFMMKLLKS